MKKFSPKWLVCALCVLLAAVGALALRTRDAYSLAVDDSVCGISLLYNDITAATAGASPQVENGQSTMDDMLRFLQSLELRWDGFQWDSGGMSLPCYRLYFVDHGGLPQTTLSITADGQVYCGHRVYRVLSPDAAETFSQLTLLYQQAAVS